MRDQEERPKAVFEIHEAAVIHSQLDLHEVIGREMRGRSTRLSNVVGKE
jgi:hypothetical protein